MRLTTFLLIATLMQVSAIGLAQKISISRTNAPLKSVLNELRLKSGYDFVYEERLLKQAKPVNIQVDGANIEDVLKVIFGKQPLHYTIREGTVVLTQKKTSIAEQPAKSPGPDPAIRSSVPEQVSISVADIDGAFFGFQRNVNYEAFLVKRKIKS